MNTNNTKDRLDRTDRRLTARKDLLKFAREAKKQRIEKLTEIA